MSAGLLEHLGSPPAPLVASGQLLRFRQSPSAEVFLTVKSALGPRAYWKEFKSRGRLEGLKGALRGSRARREVRGADLLEAAGFRAPRVLAFGERRRGCWIESSFLATAEIDGAISLLDLSRRGAVQTPVRRAWVRRLGSEIGRLHEAGLVHGDLRFSNILAAELDSPEPRLFFLDNERTRVGRFRAEGVRIRNLVQLSIDVFPGLTRTDRMRFLNAYLAARPSLAARRRAWIERCKRCVVARWHARDVRLERERREER